MASAIAKQHLLSDTEATRPRKTLILCDLKHDDKAPEEATNIWIPTADGYKQMWTIPLYTDGCPPLDQPTTTNAQLTPAQVGTPERTTMRIEAYHRLETKEDWPKRLRAPHQALRQVLMELKIEARTSGWTTLLTPTMAHSSQAIPKWKKQHAAQLLKYSGTNATFLTQIRAPKLPVVWQRQDDHEDTQAYVTRIATLARQHDGAAYRNSDGRTYRGIRGMPTTSKTTCRHIARRVPSAWTPNLLAEWLHDMKWIHISAVGAPKTRSGPWRFTASPPTDQTAPTTYLLIHPDDRRTTTITIDRWIPPIPGHNGTTDRLGIPPKWVPPHTTDTDKDKKGCRPDRQAARPRH